MEGLLNALHVRQWFDITGAVTSSEVIDLPGVKETLPASKDKCYYSSRNGFAVIFIATGSVFAKEVAFERVPTEISRLRTSLESTVVFERIEAPLWLGQPLPVTDLFSVLRKGTTQTSGEEAA